ncbi:taste receptor type 2 member 9-like [Nyctibius grandis]|uniref:taste receptor type 2 member 9-like n=1 Tax=Nyctibius grandis TaxID=48427 RepID=UPI0035BC75E7
MEDCHSQDQFNVTSYHATAVVFITLQAFAGMWINAFIVSVLCIAWVKKKSFNSNEKILLVLGCSSFWHLCIIWLYVFLSTLYLKYFCVCPIPQLLAATETFLNCFNLWVSACLSGFYCIKIANFRHVFFIYLKVKIDRLVPWLLLASVLVSLVLCVLAYKLNAELYCENMNSTALGNFSELNVGKDERFFPTYFIFGFIFATAFMAVIFSALLLLFSLWRHKCKMQTNSVKNISIDAHIKAMKFILSFFFIYSINFTCLILKLVYSMKKKKTEVVLISVFQYNLPAVHSFILIFSNPKLEKTLLRTLSWAKCKVCMR